MKMQRRLMPVIAGEVGHVRNVAAAPPALGSTQRCVRPASSSASTISASNNASAASAAAHAPWQALRRRDPGVPAEARGRIGVRVEAQRRHLRPGEHRVDREADLEAEKGAHQRNEALEAATVRKELLKGRTIERADAKDDARLKIPSAYANCGVDAKPAPGAGLEACGKNGLLIGGEKEPGAGELHNFNLASEPVGHEHRELFGGAWTAGKQPGIVKQRIDTHGEPRGQIGCGIAGK